MADRNQLTLRFTAKNEATKAFQEVKSQLDGMKSAAVAAAGVVAGVFAASKIMDFAGQTVKAASNAEESLNKMRVVMGESAAEIEAWAKTSAQAFGQSSQQATEAAASFGGLFRTMGLGEKDAATMSMRMTELASDIASFNNIDPTEALEKLRSGLVGEAEPMRQVGVLLDETTVKAKALQMGYKEVGGQLSQSAKVQARYALILEQTKLQQGDFARTSDGLANSQRRLNAAWEDIQAQLGAYLLPTVSKLVAAFADELPKAFAALQAGMQPVMRAFDLIGSTVQALVSGKGFDLLYEKLNETFGPQTAALIAGPIDALANFLHTGKALGDAFEEARLRFEIAFSVMRQVAGSFLDFWGPKVQEAIGAVEAWIASLQPALTTVVSAVFTWIQDQLSGLLAFWRDNWGTIKQVLEAAWTVLVGIIKVAWSAFSGVIAFGLNALAGDWDKAWQGLKNGLEGVWDGIKDIVKGGVEAVLGILRMFAPDLADALTRPFRDAASSIGDILKTIAKGIPTLGAAVTVMDGLGALKGAGFSKLTAIGQSLTHSGNKLFSGLDYARGLIPASDTPGFLGYAGPEARRRDELIKMGYNPDMDIAGQVIGYRNREASLRSRGEARYRRAQERDQFAIIDQRVNALGNLIGGDQAPAWWQEMRGWLVQMQRDGVRANLDGKSVAREMGKHQQDSASLLAAMGGFA